MALLLFGSTLGFCAPNSLLDNVRGFTYIQSPMIKPGTRGDLLVLRPTIMIVVPRLAKGVLDNLRAKSRFKQLLYQTCYAMKRSYRKLGYDTPVMDK
ncbi:hypothetical protein MXB_1489 [Myxobolus squamalis]|nr:hypothetical protein MXB_1489 [Myxobolus squamalis]